MGPARYWSKSMQMSADLKAVTRRVRASRPEMFAVTELKDSSMDGDGKVSYTLRKDSKATALSPAARHTFATRRE